jgi:DNA-directed RNA polymerase specialized sigma24 family protein
MAIPPELEASILRYHHVEKWRVGTIARQLGVHPDTVARALARAGLPGIRSLHRRRSCIAVCRNSAAAR